MSALKQLHDKRIVHRDLKLENFLLLDSQSLQIKLIDFGLSRRFKVDEKIEMHALVGSINYVAPEVLKGTYGMECDIWSLGVVLHLLLTGLAPFVGNNEDEIMKFIEKYDLDFRNADSY